MDEQAGPSTKRSRYDVAPVKIIHITGLKLNRFSKYFGFIRPNVSLVQYIYFDGVKKPINKKLFLILYNFCLQCNDLFILQKIDIHFCRHFLSNSS